MSSWAVRRVGDLAQLVNGYPFDSEDFAAEGDVPLVRIRDILNGPFETFVPASRVPSWAMVRNGDIVIGMDGDFNARLWDRGAAALNQRVCLLRARDVTDARFLAYALPSHLRIINDLTYATTVKHLSGSQVEHIRLQVPDNESQRRVADYLDRETTEIDGLIARQELLTRLLAERRQALIVRVVAGELAGVARKPSHLAWVDSVPEHWTIANIRRFAQMKTGHTPSRTEPEYWQNPTIPWFTLADVWQLRDGTRTYLDETEEQISELGLANSAAELLPAGTVVLSRTASVGFTGIMPGPMATSQDFWNWVCGPHLLPEYLVYVFRAMRQEFQALMIGSTHKTIYQPTAASIRIPLPPLDEQHRIVDHLDEQIARIDTLISKAQEHIALAKERRAALITEAVTGRIDVTTTGRAS